ncbi:MAG TPA: DUF5996 family protein [Anaeromyxobacteraceae bacterium]|nr:DUF5996 family protein [Anaeromyxobacteraceae bacterium]
MTPPETWPALPYGAFAPTGYLLHRGLQAIGKLALLKPFEPEWANVALELTSRGLSTGLIPSGSGYFAVEVDLVSHEIRCTTTEGRAGRIPLGPTSVARLTGDLIAMVRDAGAEVKLDPRPQEVPRPIPFHEDVEPRPYERELAHSWWRILIAAHRVLQRYHARFRGKTQPVGLMWGTFDLRDVRYNGDLPEAEPRAGYIRRNAMDASLVEAGWWPGNEDYPRPAFYSFTFPQPPEIELARVEPAAARWDGVLREFVLDYDDLRASTDADGDLLAFLETSYRAGATRAGWPASLEGSGRPI